jgi:hypothetical protein
MVSKTLSMVVIVVGVLAFLAALVLGLLGFPHPGFGYYKISLAAVGAVVAAAGVILLSKANKAGKK